MNGERRWVMILQPYLSEHGKSVDSIEAFLASELVPLASILMALHGGKLQKKGQMYLFHFPDGTYEYELLPRLHESHFHIIFPDGFKLYYATWLGMQEVCLFKKDVPENLSAFVKQTPGLEDVAYIAEFMQAINDEWQEQSYQIQEGEIWPAQLLTFQPEPAPTQITLLIPKAVDGKPALVRTTNAIVSLTPIATQEEGISS